jgi:hypothetical protein
MAVGVRMGFPKEEQRRRRAAAKHAQERAEWAPPRGQLLGTAARFTSRVPPLPVRAPLSFAPPFSCTSAPT